MTKLFISYSSNDIIKVGRLVKVLRREKSIEIWIDTERILPVMI